MCLVESLNNCFLDFNRQRLERAVLDCVGALAVFDGVGAVAVFDGVGVFAVFDGVGAAGVQCLDGQFTDALSGKQVMSASSSSPKYTLHPNGG